MNIKSHFNIQKLNTTELYGNLIDAPFEIINISKETKKLGNIAILTRNLIIKNNILYGDVKVLNTKYGKVTQGLINDDFPLFINPCVNGFINKGNTIQIEEVISFDISIFDFNYSFFEDIIETRKQKLNYLLGL